VGSPHSLSVWAEEHGEIAADVRLTSPEV